MSASEILVHLGRHGCEDITNRLELSSIGRSAISSGGFGDVHRGALRTGDRVAVKYLRMLRTAHELYIWSKCRHANILELVGVAQHNNQIAMVSPWMENGNMNWYLNRHPLVNRYNLCSQIADAVAYLRDNDIVHGDIKGANILVSGGHVPKLTDFGSSNVRKYTLGFTTTTTGPHTTLRWTAPEIFMEETKHTFEGDVYALGMTILEAFTESVPYEDLLDVAVMRRLMQRVHPERPQRCIPVGDRSSDLLWNVITSCWNKHPQNRPLALQVRDKLKAIMQPQKPVRRGTLSVNMSPHEILRYLVAHGSQDLTRDIGCVAVSHSPRSDLGGQHQYYDHWITGATQSGAQVFMGRASSLYPFNFSGASEDATATLLTAHEGYILSQCNHPNIRGIMGVALLDDSLSLVFRELEPGYQRFHEVVWTEGETRSATICKMAFQISDAVTYLHSIDIVHGAINLWNILVSPDYDLQLSGFHNAYIRNPPLTFPIRGRTIIYAHCVDIYTAPELRIAGSELQWTFETDIYALGTTILDVVTCNPNMAWRRSDYRYRIPKSEDGNRLWSLIKACRAHNPENRPPAALVQNTIATITGEDLEG